jgi:hypothetical protein
MTKFGFKKLLLSDEINLVFIEYSCTKNLSMKLRALLGLNIKKLYALIKNKIIKKSTKSKFKRNFL